MDVAVALALDNEQRLGELKEAWEKALGDLDTYCTGFASGSC